MVTIVHSNKNTKIATITLDIQDIHDIINGVNILVGKKEDEMNKHNGGDSIDKEEYKKYKELLKEMQDVKALFK